MRAFNPLFRRRMPITGRHVGIGGVIGLAGIGYAVYRWLQSPRGQEIQTQVLDGVKTAAKKWNTQSQGAQL